MKITMKLMMLMTGVLTASILICGGFAYADTIIVSPGESIQDAIDTALATDTVEVREGVYDLDAVITMKDEVDLVAQYVSAGYPEVRVKARIVAASGTSVEPVKLEGIYVDVFDFGDVGVEIPAGSQYVLIKNVIVRANNNDGITLDTASDVTIESSTVDVSNNIAGDSCIDSADSIYTAENNILTLEDPSIENANAIESDNDNVTLEYNCILGKLSPVTLAHKGTLFASPGYEDKINGDFRLAMAGTDPQSAEYYRTSSIAFDSGDPASDLSWEIQIADNNEAIDLGAYGNTRYTAVTTLPADFDLDGDADVNDLNLWKSNRFTIGKTFFDGDTNGDGDVDVNDLNIWKSHRFTTVPQ